MLVIIRQVTNEEFGVSQNIETECYRSFEVRDYTGVAEASVGGRWIMSIRNAPRES